MPDKQRLPSESDIELLSALIDGMLSDSERREALSRLNQEPELQTAYAELQRTVDLLKALPAVRAPRNYTLTPDMVGLNAVSAAELTSRRAIRTPRRTIPFPLTTAFSALSAAAAVVLLVLGASFLTLTANAPAASTVGMLSSAAAATNPVTVTEMSVAPTNAEPLFDSTGANTGELAQNGAASDIMTEESAPADAASRSVANAQDATQTELADETGTFYGVSETATILPTLTDGLSMQSNATGLTEPQLQDAQQQPLIQGTLNLPFQTLLATSYPPEAYSQEFSEGNSAVTTGGVGGGTSDMSTGQQGGAPSSAGAAMPFAQEVLPTMTNFVPLIATVVQGTLAAPPAPLIAMQPGPMPGQPPTQPPTLNNQVAMPTQTLGASSSGLSSSNLSLPTATKTLEPTLTPSPLPTDTVTNTPLPTATDIATATPIPPNPISSDGRSANSIFGIVLVGAALVFAALTAASLWARRRFDRTNG